MRSDPYFSHGQLYIEWSWVISEKKKNPKEKQEQKYLFISQKIEMGIFVHKGYLKLIWIFLYV